MTWRLMFHLVLYKRFNYLTKRLRFLWFSGRNGTTINSNHVLLICLFNDFFKICWKDLFVYFLLLYFYSFFLIRKGKHNQEMTKNRYICSSNFSFFSFFQKLYPTTKVVLERTKMQAFPVMWFRQRVIHQTISAGLKKKYLRSAMRVRAVIVEAHASSTGWVSSSLSNQERTENSLSKFMWAWNWCSLADYGYGNF